MPRKDKRKAFIDKLRFGTLRLWSKDAGKLLTDLRAWFSEVFEELLPILAPSETKFLVSLAIVIGLLTGTTAYAFDKLIHWLLHTSFQGAPMELGDFPLWSRWRVLFFPALGGLVVGVLSKYLQSESKGEGVPVVMRAMHQRGGRMSGRAAVLKACLSVITIGTGGSAGREGPIIHIGASIGSRLAQMFRVPAVTLKTMAAAGAAAGIAAAFNAPLGGMAFAMEVILGEITTGPFAMVVLSAVVASAVDRGLHGSSAYFTLPAYTLTHWGELPLYLILGVTAGFCAKGFHRLFYRMEREFETRLKVDEAWRPALGGLLLGSMGFFIPGILGPGYEAIHYVLRTGFAPGMLLLLLGGKMLGTSLTLGSGGSGGTLMPALFMGGMLGSLMGQLFAAVLPTVVNPGAYAMVGMAAMLAGMIHAPLTAILILFEMTGDYAMILPLMVAVVSAVLTGRVIEAESIYTQKLKELGVPVRPEPETALLTMTPISEIMSCNVRTIEAEFPIGQLGRHFNKVKLAGFPVLDAEGLLVGMLTYAEAQAAYTIDPPPTGDTPVRSIMRSAGKPLYADESVSEAVRRMDKEGIDRLPVVSRENPRKLVGIVSQKDLMQLYARRISK